MGLGDYFFKDGDYYRAVTEYKRFLFFFPQERDGGRGALEDRQIVFQREKVG